MPPPEYHRPHRGDWNELTAPVGHHVYCALNTIAPIAGIGTWDPILLQQGFARPSLNTIAPIAGVGTALTRLQLAAIIDDP